MEIRVKRSVAESLAISAARIGTPILALTLIGAHRTGNRKIPKPKNRPKRTAEAGGGVREIRSISSVAHHDHDLNSGKPTVSPKLTPVWGATGANCR